MIEFEINGHFYRAEKLNAIQQLHLSRKLSPLIPPLIPVFMELAKQEGSLNNLGALSDLLHPFAEGIAEMEDAAAEYVLATCLSVVRRKQGEHWAAIWNVAAKAPMFDDLNDLGTLLQISMKIVQDNLGGFIKDLLTRQQVKTATASAE